MSLPGWDGCLQILSLLELSCEGNPFAVACQDMDMEARVLSVPLMLLSRCP